MAGVYTPATALASALQTPLCGPVCRGSQMPSVVMVTTGPEHGEVAKCCVPLARGTLQGGSSDNGRPHMQLSRRAKMGVLLPAAV